MAGPRASRQPPDPTIRVAILGESQLFREGVRAMMAADPTLVVVGEADETKIRPVVRQTTPDILLVDTRIDGLFALCRELVPGGQRPWVILLAADGDLDWTLRAVQAGVRGVLGKTARAAELLRAIRSVHAGEIWVPHQVMARIAEMLVALLGATDVQQALLAQRLSARERDVIRQVVQGFSNQEIADRLEISEATVKAHLTHIFHKLEVRDRAQLVARYHDTLLSNGSA